jgi:hypothetical protein
MITTASSNLFALFFLALVSANTGAVGLTDGRTAMRDCVYDYAFLTSHECRVYRSKVLKAKTEEERLRLRQDLHRTLDARAKERGTTASDWRGLDLPPVDTGATR